MNLNGVYEMKDDISAWTPVAEHLENLSITGLETLKGMVEFELDKRRGMFYNEAVVEKGDNKIPPKPFIKLEVVK